MTESDNETKFTQADIDAAATAAAERTLEAANAQHAEDMAALRASLGPVQATPVPEHSGGIGTNLEQSWSKHDQELATRGEHPLQQEQ